MDLIKLFGKRHFGRMAVSDQIEAVASRLLLPPSDGLFVRGWGFLTLADEDGILKQAIGFHNLITQVGDQYYGERAAGIASPPGQVTGMRLGTGGATAVAKTGAGAAIVTYLSASQKAIDGSYPTSSLNGSSRRITFRTTWAAGEATGNSINEAVLTNESPLTNVAGSAANTIARLDNSSITPSINKGALDTLTLTWNHDLLGA